ncbi:hypothetical protein ACIOHH_35210 [Streptomyces microflavus]|uniref:hypothetical protein n=1 Tax=Streptomyces microflavus TaxID=1919 RepID=UPI00381541E3
MGVEYENVTGLGGRGRQDGVLELPDGIEWLNLHAVGDIVAQRGLAALAPAVRDESVANGAANPHNALRYLEKQPLADLIVKTSAV